MTPRPKRPKRSDGDPGSIRDYLKPFRIRSRWTTFNGSFQSALAVPEAYSPAKAAEALETLGQANTGPLICVYCGAPAATWDHLHNTVRNGRFSGYGHRIFNLVPACRTCNERKGGKNWRTFFETIETSGRQERIARLEAFSAKAEAEQFSWEHICREFPAQAAQYDDLITRLRNLLMEGDRVATQIRELVQAKLSDPTRMQPRASEERKASAK